MKEKYLDGLVEQINEECQSQIDNYYLTDDYSGNYQTFPLEENFGGACYYGNKDETRLEQQHKLPELCEKYGYDAVDDLLAELYENCEIKTVLGDIYDSVPTNKIVFGNYPVEEIETTLSEKLQEKINKLNDEEFSYIDNSVNLEPAINSNRELIYIYLNLLISYEMSINKAIEYLDDLKG